MVTVNMKTRKVEHQDISWMVDLSYQKRLEYSKHQPNFWRMAENSNEIQREWLEEELKNPKVIVLCCNDKSGFIVGKLIMPPEVYSAGLTLMIDDFCVKNRDLWSTIGKILIDDCGKIAKEMGAKQFLVVSGDHDKEKNQLLESIDLTIASRWYTKEL